MRLTAYLIALMTVSVVAIAPASRAQQPAPPPAAVAAATELLQALGTEKQFEAVLPMLLQQVRQVIVAANPAATREVDQMMPMLRDKFQSRKSDLVPLMAHVYARRLTVEDMKQMTAFFKSPAGQRFVITQPQLMQDSMSLGNEWGRRLGEDVDREMRQELQKRGVKL